MLYFAFLGFIGALLYVLIWAKSWQDLKSFETMRHLVIGLITGYVYAILHSEYNFPNSVMAIVIGYFGPDIIQALFEKMVKKIE